jgi:hypothetical protein
MEPVPDLLLLRKSASAGNRARISGSVARNSGHSTTEVDFIILLLEANQKFLSVEIPVLPRTRGHSP